MQNFIVFDLPLRKPRTRSKQERVVVSSVSKKQNGGILKQFLKKKKKNRIELAGIANIIRFHQRIHDTDDAFTPR